MPDYLTKSFFLKSSELLEYMGKKLLGRKLIHVFLSGKFLYENEPKKSLKP